MKRIYDLKNDEDLNRAQWFAARGAARGAAVWGAYGGLAGLAAYYYSPIYRGLTFQFKVYLQMSAMLLGGMIHADKRMQEFEQHKRHTNRIARDAEVWRRYEQDYAAEESRRVRLGAGSTGGVSEAPSGPGLGSGSAPGFSASTSTSQSPDAGLPKASEEVDMERK